MGVVDASAFAGITGQLLINRVLAAFTAEEFVVSKLIPTVPTSLNGERIPGVALPRDPGEDFVEAEEMAELQYVGFSEEYVETPATTKRQLGIGITKEAIFFDRTGLVLDRASYVGTLLGLRKEKNLIGVLIGAVNTFKEKRANDSASVSKKTYYAADDAADHNGLLDQPSRRQSPGRLDEHQRLRAAVQPDHRPEHRRADHPAGAAGADRAADPIPGPQSVDAGQQRLEADAGRDRTRRRQIGVNTLGPNPLQNLDITIATSRQLYKQIQNSLDATASEAAGYWWYGDPAAFAYMENWPITVVQAPMNSEAEFTQDIVVRFKASERGTPAVIEPRRIQRNRGVSTSSSSGS